jgi:hypothetical protein
MSVVRRHCLDDSLEVIDGGELDGDLALISAELDLNAGLESV